MVVLQRDGDWRDSVGAAGSFIMRSNYYVDDFENFDGSRLIMHCHYVQHEDNGMMVEVELMAPNQCETIMGQYIVPPFDNSNIETTIVEPTSDLQSDTKYATNNNMVR